MNDPSRRSRAQTSTITTTSLAVIAKLAGRVAAPPSAPNLPHEPATALVAAASPDTMVSVQETAAGSVPAGFRITETT